MFNPGTGANDLIQRIAIQNDGKIIIVGRFNSYNGTSRNRVARLNADGSLDETFNPGTGANDDVWSSAIQSDGRIIIGGNFTSVNEMSRNRIARLNADGSLDGTFNPGTGANDDVWSSAIQSDGRIIIGGNFTTYGGTARNRITRLNPDGSLDASFNPNTGVNDRVRSSAIQTDGKIIIGGLFTFVNGTSRNRVARLNTDGSLDITFNPGTGADEFVYTITIQSDRKIIIGGNFTLYNGTGRNRIARIITDGCSISLTSSSGTDNQSVCINKAMTNITYNINGATGATVTGLPPGVNGNFVSGVFTISGTPTQSGIFNFIVSSTGECNTSVTGKITIFPLPVVIVTGTNIICEGSSTTFTAAGGGNNLWSTGSTSSSINVNVQGTYSVTVTSTDGCISSGARTLTVNAKPIAAIIGASEICNTSSTTWIATGGLSYIWNNGTSTSSINLNNAGTYTVTVTNASGCTSTFQKVLNISASPSCATCNDGIQNGNETGVDCGGSCDPCGGCTNITVEISTDQYPTETSWNIKNSAGVVMATSSKYSLPFTLNTHTYCLPVDCYTFTINDVYADGILSPGYFNVSDGTRVLVSNSAFTTSKAFIFCLGNAIPSTCSDGIKNGDETGIDCGGSCDPCPSCSDRIKNGDETGIDCGGSCLPCATCTDGIKNGNETGIDCGGSCAPCQSCVNISVEIKTDQYPTETSWNIKNSAGVVVANSSKYTLPFTLNTHTYCLPVDCYTFTINDVYADGILAPGYFKVSDGTRVLVSNSAFTTSKSVNFCLGNAIPPTCTDGIKNGLETGIDCGGICDPCPTCTDGKKNGNETGVDCGGSCISCIQGAYVTVGGYYFEAGWDAWAAGGVDCSRYFGTLSPEGSYSIRLRDNHDTKSAMTSSTYDLSSFNTVIVEFKFRATNIESGKEFWLRYYNGWYWTTIATYIIGEPYLNNQVYTITKTLTGPFPANAKFRIQNNAPGSDDDIYIDAVSIRGLADSYRIDNNNLTQINNVFNAGFGLEGFSIIPNPADNLIQIILDNQINKIQIFNLAGQLMALPQADIDNVLDISKLNNGMYIIRVETNDNNYTQKLIKK
ncbi:MAG: T9SS type A sorting domain-containing protein [Saprospiraceae bacterium]|nr:T9SS type A sorting domain-containing protein [Saprospiraceae bacterium]